MNEFKYHTIVTCPVCGALFDDISHATPEPRAQAIAMLAVDGRMMHRKESPNCANDPKWMNGWDLKTEEIK